MRVIAGEARSLPLKTPEGQDTRPTTDRIKETLFNILQGGYSRQHFRGFMQRKREHRNRSYQPRG